MKKLLSLKSYIICNKLSVDCHCLIAGVPSATIPVYRAIADAPTLFNTSYVAYEIRVVESIAASDSTGASSPSEWTVNRRFSEFESFHKRLKSSFPGIAQLPRISDPDDPTGKGGFSLPGKTVKRLADQDLEKRRAMLQTYLQVSDTSIDELSAIPSK